LIHTELLYEQAYWEYINGHPCHVPLPKNAFEDAIAVLTWYMQGTLFGSYSLLLCIIISVYLTDRLLNSEDSIVPYSKELSKDLLDVLSVMSDNKDTFDSARNGYLKSNLVASILERAAGERVRQHYGEQGAREFLKKTLNVRREVLDEPEWTILDPIFEFCMAFLCFGTPYAYLRHINEFFMAGVGRTDTITERWQLFVDENVADWTNTNLVATVLVSASVALLAIPGIDKATRLLGIISTLFSIASIVSGLLNVWQNQHKSRTNLELTVIFDFFENAESHVKTDKLLAILLSLPMVLLIWSTLLFAASMVTFAWRSVDTTFMPPGTSEDENSSFLFGKFTAWFTTGQFMLVAVMVICSFLYFYRVWRPSNIHKDKKQIKRKKGFRFVC